ncbi:transposable element Tcb2 transposase [Trichonephila clavipes]|nr:transposable element Tcb2 transposase [Trichonephila clavipes]
MSSRHHIDDFMRGRIIGKIEEGRKITDVAREFDIAHSVVSRLWKSFKTTGMCSRRHGGGRVRSTTPAEDRYIVLSAKRNRRTTAQQVANQFLAASGKQISRKSVARRLREEGLYARRPVVCVPLTRQHRTARLQWCREHHNWTEQDWACVLFSDESRFSLSSDCRRQLIWRESGTAYRPENIQEKDRYPTCSIMVWAGIMINGRTRLHVVANGTMTGQRYIDEVLLPHVRLLRGAVGDKFVFMDDNATYLNPIENVWDALGRQVAGRNYPPTNKNTLIRALTEEWDKLPQQLLDNVVQSMVRRVECCITLHGGHIPRVHVTQATLDCLHGEYEVEPGRGADRNSYLREHNVVSYFIVPPSHRRKIKLSGQNNLLERRQTKSVGRWDSRPSFLRSDWPRPNTVLCLE